MLDSYLKLRVNCPNLPLNLEPIPTAPKANIPNTELIPETIVVRETAWAAVTPLTAANNPSPDGGVTRHRGLDCGDLDA